MRKKHPQAAPELAPVVDAAAALLRSMGFDVDNDPHMRDTPTRYARMLVQEVFAGCWEPPPALTAFPNSAEGGGGFDNLLVVGPVRVQSSCAHHLLPILGRAWIGVLPRVGSDGSLLGLSKYSRIVEHYARRPQMQELLTQQIVDHIVEHTNPRGVAVKLVATHLCQTFRGLRDPSVQMTTIKLWGDLFDPTLRAEFLQQCGG